MPPKLLLHIGPHKTGTTFVQKQLFTQTEKLRANGINYVAHGINLQYGQHRIVEEFQNTGRSPVLEQALAEFGEHELNIISSENFDRLNAEQVASLAKTLHGVDTTVVYVARRSDDLLLSNWQEDVKHGEEATWAESFFTHLVRPYSSKLLNHSLVVDLYSQNFPGKTWVLNFDTLAEDKQDLVSAIFSTVDRQPPFPVSPERINVSMNLNQVEVLRALNAMWRQRGLGRSNAKVRTAFLKILNSPQGGSIKKLAELVGANSVSHEIAGSFTLNAPQATFLSKHRSALRGRWPEQLPPVKYNLPGTAWLTRANTMLAMEDLLEAIKQQISDKVQASPNS